MENEAHTCNISLLRYPQDGDVADLDAVGEVELPQLPMRTHNYVQKEGGHATRGRHFSSLLQGRAGLSAHA